MSTIYRKTDKGNQEIATRQHRLSPRLRSALIMVDGKRTDGELRAMIPQQFDETIQSLVDDGFVEMSAVLDTERREPAAQREAPVAAKPAAATRPPAAMDFATARREMARSLIDQVGPAGEALAMRVETAANAEALRPMLAKAAQVIQGVRGSRAAEDFVAKFSAALGG